MNYLKEICPKIIELSNYMVRNNFDFHQAEELFSQKFPHMECGCGSSRIALKLSSSKVMKVAFCPLGVSQNKIEKENFFRIRQTPLRDWITDIRYVDRKNRIMIVDYANEVKDEREFRKYSGVPFVGKDPDFHSMNLLQFLMWWKKKVKHEPMLPMATEDVEWLIRNSEFTQRLNYLFECYPKLALDLTHFDNWGVVDGKLVIIDYGFDFL